MNNDFKSVNKFTHNSDIIARFSIENVNDILETVFDAVILGNSKVKTFLKQDVEIFGDSTIQANVLNRVIKCNSRNFLKANIHTQHRVKFFESYRMLYILVDRKFFICVKALGEENKIEGMDTTRFNDTISGRPFIVSKKMLSELNNLSLKELPPVMFVGYKRENNSIKEVLLQQYLDGEVISEYILSRSNNSSFDEILKTKSNFNKNNNSREGDDQLAV